MPASRILLLALAGLAAGLILGVLVTACSAETYRATAVVQVAPAPDPRQASPDAEPVAAEVLAESYARLVDSRAFAGQLAPRVADGDLDASELDERLEALRPEGSSLVEIRAEGSSRAAAERLAGEIANAFVTLVRQLEEQRSLRLETVLRGRVADLEGTIARTTEPTQSAALEAEREALAARLAAAVSAGMAVSVGEAVGPAGSAEQIHPTRMRNLLGGALLGIVCALGFGLLAERRPSFAPAITPRAPPPVPVPAGAEPEPELEPEPQPEPELEPAATLEPEPKPRAAPAAPPSVALAEPVAGAVVAGIVRLRAEVSPDVEQVQFLLSDGTPDWQPLAEAPPRLSTAAWDTSRTADGQYWLCAVGRSGADGATVSEPAPVTVANAVGGQFHWTPERYLELMHEEVPAYDRLQEETARATQAVEAERILELGIGTGETARRVLREHEGARLVGVDSSEAMLSEVPAELGADLRVADLADPLPEGPFDLVVSALAVHHLESDAKAALFRRVAEVLRPGGRFVLADVVVPAAAEDAVTPIEAGYDLPERSEDLLEWLSEAGFDATITWADRDLVVIAADLP